MTIERADDAFSYGWIEAFESTLVAEFVLLCRAVSGRGMERVLGGLVSRTWDILKAPLFLLRSMLQDLAEVRSVRMSETTATLLLMSETVEARRESSGVEWSTSSKMCSWHPAYADSADLEWVDEL